MNELKPGERESQLTDADRIDREIEEIQSGLAALLVGKNKNLAIVAALSVAATTAHLIGMPKLELQKILISCYDRRIVEKAAQS